MLQTRTPSVAFVGNPNSGKSTLFNALAGMRQRVGNYPGVTVETKKGNMTHAGQTFQLIDLPGTYSLAPRSPDEMVAVDLLLGHQDGELRPDVVVALADASNLERHLFLTTQLLELGVPTILALNMMDVARSQGMKIDVDRLQRQIGLSVVPLQANKGMGLDLLRAAIATSLADRPPKPRVEYPQVFECEVASLAEKLGPEVPTFLIRRVLLDPGGTCERRLLTQFGARLAEAANESRQRLARAGCPVTGLEARVRYAWIRRAVEGCVQRPEQPAPSWTDRFDRILTHRIWGSVVFLVLMLVVFQAIFAWSQPMMDGVVAGKEWIARVLRDSLPSGPLSSLLVDGIIEGVGSVLVFLPQIVILFGLIAVLEDCGYMARAAFLMDKIMSRCGLSGKSFIPLLSSVACAGPGIMGTRVIEDRRDRLATILVAPLMSCSARLPVYLLLIGAFLTEGHAWWVPGATLFCMYGIGLVTAPAVALLLKRTLLRGETPSFVMEMPLYKCPAIGTVLGRMLDSGKAFLRRAGTLILAATVLVWASLYFPRADHAGRYYEERILEHAQRLEALKTRLRTEPAVPAIEKEMESQTASMRALTGEWKRNSLLGSLGRVIEPTVRPLGWDWRIGMAVLASFPAREVVVGTLGIIYNQGSVDSEEIVRAERVSETGLGMALQRAEWEDEPGRPVFSVPVALSLMVFFALCCQCVSTLAVIKRETNSWAWPAITFVYMTVLAYAGAFLVYQIASRIGGSS